MTGSEEPEVQAMMKLAYSLPITGSASLHEGALVANYPWDGDKEKKQGYSAAPDDATFQYLAKSYAQRHPRMAKQTPYPGEVQVRHSSTFE
jgi:carboxypeptidase D